MLREVFVYTTYANYCMLSDGSISTFKAKESLENLLGDRLWPNQLSFWKFRQHQCGKRISLYQIRPPTLPAWYDYKYTNYDNGAAADADALYNL